MNEMPNAWSEPTEVQRSGMRNVIAAQCFNSFALLAFSNGLVLVFLTALGVSGPRTVAYLALPFLGDSLFRLLFALVADRYGKKRVGFIGSALMGVGFVIIALAGSMPAPTAEMVTVTGIAVYALGIAVAASSWFALLSPIVPESLRGRFFGRLRLSWQTCGIAFTAICALFLSKDSPISAYQVVFGVIALALGIRLFFYARVPEMESARQHSDSLRESFRDTMQADGYVSFCAYVFLLSLFTAGCPSLFGLIEKRVMNLGDNVVVWVGSLLMVGSVVGYFAGGKIVDRYTTKPAFLGCHFGYGAILLLFLARGCVPGSTVAVIGLAHFLFGFVFAVSSVSISTEMLALIPAENKSLSTSLCMALMKGGGGLSGVMSAWALNLGFLKDDWTLWGQPMSSYDAILLVYAAMVVLLVVTLGLVPSVLNKSQWVPQD